MPTYSYACTECGHTLDAVQAFTEDALTTCPQCSGRLRKLFNSVGVVFKGSGFYRNDSREAAKSSSANDSGSSAVQCSLAVCGADLCVAEHVRAGAIRDAAVMTQDLHSMLFDMPPDTTIKVERQLRERIRGAAQSKSMTINQFLETLMKDYDRRDRMTRAAEAMRSASPKSAARPPSRRW